MSEALVYPMDRERPLDPPDALRALRAEHPVSKVRLWNGSDAWLVTRHADVRALLRERSLSADVTRPGFPLLFRGRAPFLRRRPSFIRMDDPEHGAMRRMLTREFMVKQVAALRPRIQAIVEAFALPLPSLVICELLGVPYGDHHYFQERTRTILRRATPPEDAMRAADELYDYLDRFVSGQEEVPADTLIGRLVVDRRRTGDLDHDQLVGIALLLLVAGHETTANMTSLSVLSVLQHPEWLAALRADPALVPAAVEELLRFHTIVQYGVPRVATADVEIDGALIRAGEGVILSLAAANRDGEAFAHPDELDIHRQAPSHVAFGFGVHQCLGQPLARVELQVALAAIVDRLPGLRLAIPSDEVPFRDDMLIYGVHALPVVW